MSFIFGGDTAETPETVAMKRRMAEHLLAGRRNVTDVGSGLAELGNAIAFNRTQSRADAGMKAGQSQADKIFSPLMQAFGGGRKAAPNDNGGISQGAALPAPNTAPQGGMDMKTGIMQTAQHLGIDPLDLATVVSYETAGSFDPLKRGPTTQHGQHRGLIQFGEPQAKKYGVDWNNPIESQFGPNGAIAKYLTDAGVKPGMGRLDLYSAINAGRVGRNNASDANNGGAPGTVADKVRSQMSGHEKNALKLLGADYAQGQKQPLPTQVAMNGPVAGLLARPASAPPEAQAPLNVQQPPQMPQEIPQQQAQTQSDGPDMQMLLQAANDPWVMNDPQKAGTVKMLLEQAMKRQDPTYQMGIEQSQMALEKGRLELDALKNPAPKPLEPPQAPKVESGYDKDGNETKFQWDAQSGQWIPMGGAKKLAAKSSEPPAGYRLARDGNLEFIPGGPADPRVAGMGKAAGGNVSEGEFNAAGFADRLAEAEAVISDPAVESAGLSYSQKALGSIPGFGNSLVKEETQKFEQAQRNFITAVLRRESGAAIADSEFDNAKKQYFPQPGDSDEVKAQKKQARLTAQENMRRSANRAAPQNMPEAPLRQGGDQPPQSVQAPPNFPEGTRKLNKRDGKVYVVRNGMLVPEE